MFQNFSVGLGHTPESRHHGQFILVNPMYLLFSLLIYIQYILLFVSTALCSKTNKNNKHSQRSKARGGDLHLQLQPTIFFTLYQLICMQGMFSFLLLIAFCQLIIKIFCIQLKHKFKSQCMHESTPIKLKHAIVSLFLN